MINSRISLLSFNTSHKFCLFAGSYYTEKSIPDSSYMCMTLRYISSLLLSLLSLSVVRISWDRTMRVTRRYSSLLVTTSNTSCWEPSRHLPALHSTSQEIRSISSSDDPRDSSLPILPLQLPAASLQRALSLRRPQPRLPHLPRRWLSRSPGLPLRVAITTIGTQLQRPPGSLMINWGNSLAEVVRTREAIVVRMAPK